MPGRLATLIFLIAASCADDGLGDAFVYGGQAHDTDFAVVLVNQHPTDPRYARGLCTGVLIGERVVLTAGHCVRYSELDATGQVPEATKGHGPRAQPGEVAVAVGSHYATARPYGTVVAIESTYGDDGSFGADDDLAALILDRAGYLHPRELATGPGAVGDAITDIGFGMAGDSPATDDDSGQKRIGSGQVTAVADRSFQTTLVGCPGDSGSPGLLPDGRVWGILSLGYHTDRDPCVFGNVWARVDAHADLIARAFAAAPDSPARPRDGADVCEYPDATDATSGNETAASATALVDLADTSWGESYQATLHRPGDVDAYRLAVADWPFGTLEPTATLESSAIRQVLVGGDLVTDTQLQLCVGYARTDGVPITGCLAGALTTIDGAPMCCAAPEDGGRVTATVDAERRWIDDAGVMTIRVERIGGTNQCASYSLRYGA